jgi:cytidylate kinase
MGSVTIAATYGAGGSVIGSAVAERLGLPLIERAIPISLAAKLAHPLRVALADDVLHDGRQMTRILFSAINMSGLFVGVPIPPGALGVDDRIAATERALRQAADAGGAVILGRAGVFVLAGRPDTLHVRIDGPPEARLRQAMEHERIDEAAAAKQLRDTDQARKAYVKHFYPEVRWEDPCHYHLWLDSTVISLGTCVDLIVAGAKDRFVGAQRQAAQV